MYTHGLPTTTAHDTPLLWQCFLEEWSSFFKSFFQGLEKGVSVPLKRIVTATTAVLPSIAGCPVHVVLGLCRSLSSWVYFSAWWRACGSLWWDVPHVCRFGAWLSHSVVERWREIFPQHDVFAIVDMPDLHLQLWVQLYLWIFTFLIEVTALGAGVLFFFFVSFQFPVSCWFKEQKGVPGFCFSTDINCLFMDFWTG